MSLLEKKRDAAAWLSTLDRGSEVGMGSSGIFWRWVFFFD